MQEEATLIASGLRAKTGDVGQINCSCSDWGDEIQIEILGSYRCRVARCTTTLHVARRCNEVARTASESVVHFTCPLPCLSFTLTLRTEVVWPDDAPHGPRLATVRDAGRDRDAGRGTARDRDTDSNEVQPEQAALPTLEAGAS